MSSEEEQISENMNLIYERVKEEFGEAKALEVINNLDEYYGAFLQVRESKEILEDVKKLIDSNKDKLSNIYISGDSFNFEESYFYANKDNRLVFEDAKSNKVFQTRIDYEEFKQIADLYKDIVAESLCYIDTSDEEIMNEIVQMHFMKQLIEFVLENNKN